MESKRDKLVDATKALLWQVGYESMSPRRILDESGAGQGSLYHHFKGKLDLAAVVLGEIEKEMKEEFDVIFDMDIAPLERIHRYLSVQRSGLKGCRLGRLANEQAIREDKLRDPIASYFGYVEKKVENALREAINTGDLPADIDPAQIALTIISSVQGGYILSKVHSDPTHVRKATAGAGVLLRMLSRKAN